MLAVARNEMHARVDVGEQILILRRPTGKDHHAGHVHVGRRVLEVQERCVKGRQTISGHCSPLSWPTATATTAAALF